MATRIQQRRGTAAQHDNGSGFTGAEGELTVDTTNDTVRVHDGSLKGGHVMAKLSDVQAEDTLAEMNDVNLTSPADGSVLKYDNASSKWIDSAKLTETSSGIAVTGTVAASDGLTADYIDLTGGESTTTTGTITCKQIVLDDLSTTQNDASTIFTEASGTTSSLVISQADDIADKIKLRVGSASTLVDALTASTDGIDVTGTVTADSLAVQPPSGDAAASLTSATGQSVLTVQSTFDGDESAEVAAIEVGAKSLAFIDFKAPSSDDYDLRIYHSDPANHSMVNSLTDDLFLRSGAKVALQHGGANTKLETTATGIDVTGNITVSGTVDGRDIATDGTKLNTIAENADVTNTAKVVAALTAGTNIAIANNGTITSTDTNTTYSVQDGELSQNSFTNDDHTKLNGIEASADVTDATNVVAALTAGTNIAIANNGTISSTDTNTTFLGGTGLTLSGTTFNVDAAQTGITSVGTLSSLTTGATTVNGSLSVNSTTADTSYSPEIVLERNGGSSAGDDGDKLGVITFKGDNTSGTQAVYAQIGARIVNDGVDNADTKGEIRIACGYNNTSNLEDPVLRIDHKGLHINESAVDGSSNANFYNVAGGQGGLKFWASNASSGFATAVQASTPTANRTIKLPDVTGTVVVAGVAGGSLNGGGGLGTAKTAWTPAQFLSGANTDYYHYTASGTDVDLVVAVPFSGIDLGADKFGSKFIFRNISAEAGSKITIDLNGFTSSSSQGQTQYYSINKYDGSTPSLITSAASDLVISVGGVIEMIPISAAVWYITGVGFA